MTASPRFAIVPIQAILDPGLSDRELRLYALLRAHADQQAIAFPRQNRLAAMLGSSRNRINQWLRGLAAKGWITALRGQRGCLYRVNLAPVASDPDVTPRVTSEVELATPAPDAGTALWDRMLGSMPETVRESMRAWAIEHESSYRQLVAAMGELGISTERDRRQRHLPLLIRGGSMDGIEVLRAWAEVRAELERRLGPAMLKAWIDPLRPRPVDACVEGCVVMEATTRFVRDWVRGNYEHQLLSAWRKVAPAVSRVEIVAAEKQRKGLTS